MFLTMGNTLPKNWMTRTLILFWVWQPRKHYRFRTDHPGRRSAILSNKYTNLFLHRESLTMMRVVTHRKCLLKGSIQFYRAYTCVESWSSTHCFRITRTSPLELFHLLVRCADAHQSVNVTSFRSADISGMIITEVFLVLSTACIVFPWAHGNRFSMCVVSIHTSTENGHPLRRMVVMCRRITQMSTDIRKHHILRIFSVTSEVISQIQRT